MARTGEIFREYEAGEQFDANGKVVCPGFIDPHTHIVFAGDRLNEFELKIKGADYLEILAGGGGIISTVRQTRLASVQDLVSQARVRLDKMLACGTTTVEIKTGYGLDTETEMKMLAAIEELDLSHPIDIVPTFLAAHAVPPEFKEQPEKYVNLDLRYDALGGLEMVCRVELSRTDTVLLRRVLRRRSVHARTVKEDTRDRKKPRF